jgi:hypothetical protein
MSILKGWRNKALRPFGELGGEPGWALFEDGGLGSFLLQPCIHSKYHLDFGTNPRYSGEDQTAVHGKSALIVL